MLEASWGHAGLQQFTHRVPCSERRARRGGSGSDVRSSYQLNCLSLTVRDSGPGLCALGGMKKNKATRIVMGHGAFWTISIAPCFMKVLWEPHDPDFVDDSY